MSNQDIPSGEVQDNDYKSRTGQSQVPVVSDDQDVMNSVGRDQADSDAQLEADDKDAIDQGNVMKERTRGAAKSSGTYQEPGDEEGLPGAEDGTSRITGSGV